MYTYEHERPALTADVVALRGTHGAREVLLIRRGNAPFPGMWALPGGFVDPFEPPDAAARRELAEETGLLLKEGVPFSLLGVYGERGRDPRGWTVSAVYVAEASPEAPDVVGGDDAAEARWHAVSALPPLAFDHARIIADALAMFDTDGSATLD